MSFNTPNGTRGGRPFSTEQMKQFNEPNIARIRRGENLGNILVLVTVGKRSGQVRENPVAYFPTSDGSYLVVASAAGGAKHPAWYFNLGAHPDQVRVVLGGKEVPVTAEELQGTDRDHVWTQIKAASAGFAQYEQMTDRTIPVIKLTPATA